MKYTSEDIDKSLDNLKDQGDVLLSSYPFYISLIELVGDKATYVQIADNEFPHLWHHCLKLGECVFCPDRRIP